MHAPDCCEAELAARGVIPRPTDVPHEPDPPEKLHITIIDESVIDI